MGKYVELSLSEFNIPNRSRYQKWHNPHPNLIYGYDENNIYVLGVNDGYPAESKVPNEDFIRSYSDANNKNHIIYEMDFIKSKYEFNIEYYKQSLYDYLKGKPQSLQIYNLSHHTEFVNAETLFGIDIYDALMSDSGLHVMKADERIAYLLYEHKSCMFEGIDFLLERGYLSGDGYKVIKADADKLKAVSRKLLHIVLKNDLTPDIKINEKVINSLSLLKEIECRCYPALIGLLTL